MNHDVSCTWQSQQGPLRAGATLTNESNWPRRHSASVYRSANAGFQSVHWAAATDVGAFTTVNWRGGSDAGRAAVIGVEREPTVARRAEHRGPGSRKVSEYPARRCLTTRSSRGPTAWHQAREAVRHIILLAGLAPHRRPRLSSNVRPLK